MPVCVFEGCVSGSKMKILIKPKNIVHLHKFPKNIELRKKWLHQIKQGSSIQDVNFDKAVVCSLHFGPQHLEPKPLCFEGINSPKCSRRLKIDAIPLSKYGCEYSSPTVGMEIIEISTPSGIFKVTPSPGRSNLETLSTEDSDITCKRNLFEITCEEKIIKLQNEELVRKNAELQKLVFEQNNWINLEACRFENKFRSTLSNMFSPQQITMILHKKKKVGKWEPEDIASAITLRSISPKAYRYLRDKLEFPLPGELAKTKWKNLCDSYMRFKKSVKGETGQAKKYHKWPWSSHMEFLDDTLKFRPPSSNIPDMSIGSPNRPEIPPQAAQSSDTHESIISPSTKQMPPPLTPRKKLKSHHEFNDVEKVIDYLQTKKRTQLDGTDHLFLSYANTFKKFHPQIQAELKQLATLFAKTELRELREQVRPIYYSDNSATSSPNSQYSFESQSQLDNLLIIITNTSLKLMFEDVKKRYPDVKYILTRRVNQDVLENLFSSLKSMMSSAYCITPLEFNLRWYILGKYSNTIITENRNTDCDTDECLFDCLSAVIINEAEIS
ncbi:hypothetical protein AGLY_011446 [Aphis glycines]|uniref:THAP-type domain-containing protein n=1 Tax=Aphis glycines TaxID=307491 RepID=A0A6G0TBR3_APHGL|nr:hypothetical protein AGLY_011446 [Aphis glycines]